MTGREGGIAEQASSPVRHRVLGAVRQRASVAGRGAANRHGRRGRRRIAVRAVRDGLSIGGLLILVLYLVPSPGWDVLAYWGVNAARPYWGVVGTPSAFLYSPVAALIALPLHLIPFALFRLLWLVLDLACLWWLAGPWALAWICFVPVAQDMFTGNIDLLLAAAVVAGFRYPAAWSFVVLTKVTPAIGLLWFAVRREWRSLAIALGVTAALSIASLVLVPAWWVDWARTLEESTTVSTGPGWFGGSIWVPLWPRLPLAAGMVAWGAITNRRWTVPVAGLLAIPAFWSMSLAMLVGVAPLVSGGRAAKAGFPGARVSAAPSTRFVRE